MLKCGASKPHKRQEIAAEILKNLNQIKETGRCMFITAAAKLVGE